MTLFGLCAQDYFSRAGHELLDWLGFIFDPADAINFLWYTAEGNAAMAAATAVAIVPAAGSFIAKGTKQAIKAGKKAAQKAGEKAAKNATEKAAKKAAAKKLAKEATETGVEKAAKEAAEKATEKTAKETAEKTAKEAAEKGIKSGSSTKPKQVHHYATNKSKTYTPQLEEISNKYGMDLDDAWNKDLLPHQGRHPNAYHEYILNSMKQFDEVAQGDKDVFLKLFDDLKNNVKSNPDMLYKDYWK